MTLRGTLSFLAILFLLALATFGTGVFPSSAGTCDTCIDCHGNLEAIHGDFNHSAILGSGNVTVFADTDHDEAGQSGETPYFDVAVDCVVCHNNDLPAAHGGDCATCHPTPYDTVDGVWEGGCQQGGCHSSYHADSTRAHLPFEDTSNPENECSRCHEVYGFSVTQSKCLNCHAVYDPGDVTPPVTTTNTQAEYTGEAKIDFSITKNGKVGVGRTSYRLDGGTVTTASHVVVSEPGDHQLEYWSKDQYGISESAPNSVFFAVLGDTTPPTTTSDAQSNYKYGSATITLTATDNSTRGVKNTYFSINGGSTQTGTKVSIGTNGTYTLTFWSEDWSGNVETQNSVSFTVESGPGTIRLVWNNCDLYPNQAPTSDHWAGWTIRKGGYFGEVVAQSNSDQYPNWNGINDFEVPVTGMPYYVKIYTWSWSEEEEDEFWITNVYVTTPGQIVRYSY